jgi:hypothetical protein
VKLRNFLKDDETSLVGMDTHVTSGTVPYRESVKPSIHDSDFDRANIPF